MKNVDLNDVLIFAGLVMLGVGLALISPVLALCVIGGLLLALGVVGAYRKGASK